MQKLTFPASLEQLSVIRQMISENITPEYQHIQLKAELAIEELLANICNYAYQGKQGKASVCCSEVNLDGHNYFTITITDDGKPYDPFTMAPEPNIVASIEERPIGGVGIYLIKQVASHYMYSRINNQNVIQLFFGSINVQ